MLPLSQIDLFLDKLQKSEAGSATDTLVENLFSTVLVQVGASTRNEEISAIDDFFNTEMGTDAREFCAACMLRLLAAPSLDQKTVARAIHFIDLVVGKEIYPQINLDIRQQTYEKIRILRDLPERMESNFTKTIESLSNLDALGTFQNEFMKRLKWPPSRAIIEPFLPSELTATATISALFNGVRQ